MSIEIPLNDRLTVEQAIAAANAAKRSAQQALADIPAVIDAEVGPASAPYITQAVNAKDDAVAAKTASEAARDDALATERRIRTQSLGAFADDAAAVAWAAAQTPPITIVTGASYLNTTSDIFRYAVVSAGPTITWHDVTEDEAAQAALATASAVSAANVKADLDTRFLPAASVDPSYVGGTPPWVNGARYLNTLSGKERVWSGGAWHDYDEAAQAAANVKANLDTRFLPAAATDPTYTGGSPPWVVGAIYLNTSLGRELVWDGTSWRDPVADAVANADAVTLSSAEAAATINPGAPVYVSGASAMKRAKADAWATVNAIGLAMAAAAPAASAAVKTAGPMTLTTAQWDAVTGATGGLTPGARYFLSPSSAGGLTTTPPTTAGQFAAPVGIAISATTMLVRIASPLAL